MGACGLPSGACVARISRCGRLETGGQRPQRPRFTLHASHLRLHARSRLAWAETHPTALIYASTLLPFYASMRRGEILVLLRNLTLAARHKGGCDWYKWYKGTYPGFRFVFRLAGGRTVCAAGPFAARADFERDNHLSCSSLVALSRVLGFARLLVLAARRGAFCGPGSLGVLSAKDGGRAREKGRISCYGGLETGGRRLEEDGRNRGTHPVFVWPTGGEVVWPVGPFGISGTPYVTSCGGGWIAGGKPRSGGAHGGGANVTRQATSAFLGASIRTRTFQSSCSTNSIVAGKRLPSGARETSLTCRTLPGPAAAMRSS